MHFFDFIQKSALILQLSPKLQTNKTDLPLEILQN